MLRILLASFYTFEPALGLTRPRSRKPGPRSCSRGGAKVSSTLGESLDSRKRHDATMRQVGPVAFCHP